MEPVVRPLCPGCGEPIGAYEPLTRVTATREPEPTSWLALDRSRRYPGETLWHAVCARLAGLRSR